MSVNRFNLFIYRVFSSSFLINEEEIFHGNIREMKFFLYLIEKIKTHDSMHSKNFLIYLIKKYNFLYITFELESKPFNLKKFKWLIYGLVYLRDYFFNGFVF